MLKIQTVLCPTDFSAISEREIKIGAAVCRAFDATLLLHHNVAAAAPGFGKAWEWDRAHVSQKEMDAEVNRGLQNALAKVPAGVRAEGCVTSGPLGAMLLGVAEARAVDLVVMGTHGWSTADHESVTERLITAGLCPILTIQEGRDLGRPFTLQSGEGEESVQIAVAVDLSSSAGGVLKYAFELARSLPVSLHLFHVLPGTPVALHDARRELESLVPADIADRVQCQVAAGNAVEEILAFLDRLQPQCLIVGEHARGFLRRLFTQDTAREILHRARWPVWFIPPGYVVVER